MTLSEDEQHILDEIETLTRSADPGFAANLNLVAAQARRRKRLALSRYGFWLGFVILMVGAGSARGPISAGVLVACYGLTLMVWGNGHRSAESRSPGTATADGTGSGKHRECVNESNLCARITPGLLRRNPDRGPLATPSWGVPSSIDDR